MANDPKAPERCAPDTSVSVDRVWVETRYINDPLLRRGGYAYDSPSPGAVEFIRSDLCASPLPPPGSEGEAEMVERMAIGLWREEARVGTPGTYARRTLEAWVDQADDTKARWRRFALAAFRALAPASGEPK